jgi:3-phenylpropionate/cinnamic acid dioxygenase small subunit
MRRSVDAIPGPIRTDLGGANHMTAVQDPSNSAYETADLDRQVRALQRRYVRAVDEKRLDEWVSLFAVECSYIVTTRENEERGLPLALVCDDSNDRIRDRVVYIQDVWKDHFNDYRQRHILSQPEVSWFGGEARASVSFAVYISEPTKIGSQLLATGEYVDVVVFERGVARFREKRVILDADVLPRYFVYPL